MSTLIQEMRAYCNNVTRGALKVAIDAMSEDMLRVMIDGQYEGGYSSWAADMLPKPDRKVSRDLDPKFAFTAQLRELMGRPFRLQLHEEVLAVRVLHMTDAGDFTDDDEREDITQYDARIVVSTVFTHTSESQLRLKETKQTVTMRVFDASWTPGEFRLLRPLTIRVPRPDFKPTETCGQYARIFDVAYVADKRTQEIQCARPQDTSWLRPHSSIRSLDRII